MNPFKISVFVNCLILGIYSLGWSYDYQNLSFDYLVMIFFVNCANIIFGILMSPYCKINSLSQKITSKGFYLVLVLFLLDALYSGTVPLLSIFIDPSIHYKKINHIPTIYPLYTALNVLYSLRYFHVYLIGKNKSNLYKVFLLLLLLLLGMGRGVFFVVIFSLIFIYLNTLNYRFKNILLLIFKPKIIAFSAGLVFVFLLFGNIRPVSDSRLSELEVSEVFTFIGKAKPDVINSPIKTSLYPLYLYLVSPTANMNNLAANLKKGNESLTGFLVHNFVPESFHKVLYKERELNRKYLVIDYFNVSTSFVDAFLEFRFVGIIIFQLIFYFIFYIGLLAVSGTSYKTIYLSLFTTILILSNFANMFIVDSFLIPLFIMIISTFYNKFLSIRK
jgi:hypothetical protein